MTKGEFSKGVTIRLITAVVFGVIGSFAIYYALQMVAIFGEGMGVDARSKEIYANSHMIVHLFGAACSLAIGVFILNRSQFLTFLAIVALLTCGGYGILNMVGFTSTNRVSVAAAKDAGNAASEREYRLARADLEKQIDWANKTAAGEEGREKRRLLAYSDAKRRELGALKAPRPTAETVLSDAQASTLAELTNTSARTWLLALPIPLAVLLFFAESFSFVVVGHMLSGAVALIAGYRAQVEPASKSSGSGGSGGSEPFKPRVVGAEPAKAGPMRAKEAGSSRLSQPEPDKASRVHASVISTDAPNGKLSRDQVMDRLRRQIAGKEPKLSTRQNARNMQWPQRTIARYEKRLRDQARSTARRFAGNGGGLHFPAIG